MHLNAKFNQTKTSVSFKHTKEHIALVQILYTFEVNVFEYVNQ